MENLGHQLRSSIFPFLPLSSSSGVGVSYSWPPQVNQALQALSEGPNHSQVDSGEVLSVAISDLRTSLSLPYPVLFPSAADGYALFFDEFLSREESGRWFGELIPAMANLLLRLPLLLESHYQDAIRFLGVPTALRFLQAQHPGIVILTQVHRSGLIEDHLRGVLEVDFANKYLGGGALHRGCVQEEIRFMINPELIVGMLFMPSMSDNEAIEIVGAERYSDYTGYASTFRFSGDYVDQSETDSIGRRTTRIIAIDALCWPGHKQFGVECLLREVNKAFCAFLDQLKHQHPILESDTTHKVHIHKDNEGVDDDLNQDQEMVHEVPSASQECNNRKLETQETYNHQEEIKKLLGCYRNTGVATGNWGCGAFGGDPEVKAVIQWIAASQASRPLIAYCTFGLAALENTDQILSHEWTVEDLWNMLLEYCSKRVKGETGFGFFSCLLPSSSTDAFPPLASVEACTAYS